MHSTLVRLVDQWSWYQTEHAGTYLQRVTTAINVVTTLCRPRLPEVCPQVLGQQRASRQMRGL